MVGSLLIILFQLTSNNIRCLVTFLLLKKIEEYLKNVPGIDLYNTEIEHIGENYDNVNQATGLAGLHKAVDLE